jgi:hypothetical protein
MLILKSCSVSLFSILNSVHINQHITLIHQLKLYFKACFTKCAFLWHLYAHAVLTVWHSRLTFSGLDLQVLLNYLWTGFGLSGSIFVYCESRLSCRFQLFDLATNHCLLLLLHPESTEAKSSRHLFFNSWHIMQSMLHCVLNGLSMISAVDY